MNLHLLNSSRPSLKVLRVKKKPPIDPSHHLESKNEINCASTYSLFIHVQRHPPIATHI